MNSCKHGSSLSSSTSARSAVDDGLRSRANRYTAVTCGPDEFNDRTYTLRPTLYNRQTELFIVVTMYNENEELFCRTLHGVMSTYFLSASASDFADQKEDGYRKYRSSLQEEEKSDLGSGWLEKYVMVSLTLRSKYGAE